MMPERRNSGARVTVVVTQCLCKHVLLGNSYAHVTMEELLEAVFSVRSVQRLYLEN
jgi:hypothetical protein